ncbi:winged helix-turn-helix domain-containing protein [Faecalicoccus pleomorphus]|uniref:winged helix-turn-helix domain-containing protein n=1 Tax=Faecalicoccus pleomorphus TaxID=1323 RepID=UPI00195F62A5|nr:helix-turn-helix domain-containing protein [Faecalicoccus pleomorphus]MBM6809021.1 response regulator transcription factor [Faecalicoccus pleomorphus]
MSKTMDNKINLLGNFCMENHISMTELQKLVKDREEKRTSSNEDHFENFKALENKTIRSGDIKIDFEKKLAYKDKKLLNVHEHEFLILQMLVSNQKEVISDIELLDLLRMYHHEVTRESLIVYASRISKMVGVSPIEEKYIRRMQKRGYYWSFSVTKK